MITPRPALLCLALASLAGCVDANQLVAFGCDGSACTGADAGADAGGLASNGSACQTSSDCGSGFCVAGLCCNNGCSGACETCAAPTQPGTCTLRTAGSACGDFACDGVTGVCPTSCDTVSRCASGRTCQGAPGGVCADEDECAVAGRCGANATCTNTPGSFSCACDDGFMGLTVTGTSTTCVDVNECGDATRCGANAVCANTEGSFECSCAPGYFGATRIGEPVSCSAVNNCTGVLPCGNNAICASTATSFTCTCRQGFSGPVTTGAPAACADANECATAGICGTGAACLNTQGSFTCQCLGGYVGSSTVGTAASCTDVDECVTSGLCGANGVCANAPAGHYTCSCGLGFFGTPVVDGPVTCSTVDNCTSSISCGAHATCATTPTSYTCACDAGYAGATTTGAPAVCVDTDECLVAGVCGANAVCTNTAGSFGCACQGGFTGPATTGVPTTCLQSLEVLGQVEDLASELIVTLSQAVPAGAPLIAAYAMGSSNTPSLIDSRGNTWLRVVNNQNCGACGATGIFVTTLTTALQAGDTIRLTNTSQRPSGLWVASAPAFPSIDMVGTAQSVTTNMPTAVTNSPVSDPFELLVGVLGTGDSNECKNGVPLTPLGGAQVGLQYAQTSGSALIGYQVRSGLSGTQAFTASSPLACRFSGVVASFYGGAPAAPTVLTLSHTANQKSFSVGWTGGRGNGGAIGCQVQVNTSPSSWTSVGVANCDATTSARSVSLPSTNGWSNGNWSSLGVRLVRVSDGAILGTFPQPLTCALRPSSNTATPTLDEDCDGSWDDHTCASYGWVLQGTTGLTTTACTNTQGTATTYACIASAEGVTRYTDGTGTGPLNSPTTRWSSDQVGTACQGTYTGAAEWLCSGSTCTWY